MRYKSLEQLYYRIVFGNNDATKFIGIPSEANSGKTHTTCKAMITAYTREIDLSSLPEEYRDTLDNKPKRSVYICLETKEVKAVVMKIYEMTGRILAKIFIKLSEEEKEEIHRKGEQDFYVLDTKDLFNTPILVTTHARYINACKYKEIGVGTTETKNFVKSLEGFDNLIVDEGLDPVEQTMVEVKIDEILNPLLTGFTSFGNTFYKDTIFKYLNPLILYMYEYRIIPLDSWVRGSKINTTTTFKQLEEYKNILCTTILDKIESDNEKVGLFEVWQIRKVLEEVHLIYRNLFLINDKKKKDLATVLVKRDNMGKMSVSTYDHLLEFIKLENNFILNASADFLSYYDSKLFKKVKGERLIDHSNATVIINKINTSSSSYSEDSNDTINKTILNDATNGFIKENYEAMALTVFDKEFQTFQLKHFDYLKEKFKDSTIFYHKKQYNKKFYYLNEDNEEVYAPSVNSKTCKGTNKYSNYKDAVICHTTRMPLEYYVFLREYYWGKKCENINYTKSNEGIVFEDEVINSMYKEVTADYWYQTIKRIQRGFERNPDYGTKYIFYTTCMDIMEIVLKQLNGLKQENIIINDSKISRFRTLIEYLQSDSWVGLNSLTNIEKDLGLDYKVVRYNLNLIEYCGVFKKLGIKNVYLDNEPYLWKPENKFKYTQLDIHLMDEAKKPPKLKKSTKGINLNKLDKFIKEHLDSNITEKRGEIKDLENIMKSTFEEYRIGKRKLTRHNIEETIQSLGYDIRMPEIKGHKGNRSWGIYTNDKKK